MKVIVVNTRFSAIHCWPECPISQVEYLRNPHRHEFHVCVKWKVNHNDRDIEFIMAKLWLDDFLYRRMANRDIGRMSCEDIADEIYQATIQNDFACCFVSVFEDGENGVEATYETV